MRRKIVCLLVLLSLPIKLFANGANFHFGGGAAWASFDKTDYLYLNSFVENSYALSNTTKSTPMVNIGMGYRWDQLFSKYPQWSFDLGVNAFYLSYDLSGINSPFVNVGQFDTLTFHVTNDSYSVLIEPKMIYTFSERLQPYLLGGVGVAWNRVYGYSETPTNPALSAAPMPNPFRSKTSRNVAFEVGLGLQTVLLKTKTNSVLNLTCDYRYLNLGSMQLGTTPSQTTSRGPNLGLLVTHLLNLGLEYQLA